MYHRIKLLFNCNYYLIVNKMECYFEFWSWNFKNWNIFLL